MPPRTRVGIYRDRHRVRLAIVKRIRGGTAGILASIPEGDDTPDIEAEPGFIPHSPADRRAAKRRADAREKRLATRSPF